MTKTAKQHLSRSTLLLIYLRYWEAQNSNRRLTQSELAEEYGITRVHVNRIVNREHDTLRELLVRLGPLDSE